MKFRKIPAEVEAYQITEDLISHVLFKGATYPKGLRLSSASSYRGELRSWYGAVTTIHGQEAQVTIGDWIITEPDGEHFYPCKPDIFAEIYECVE